MRNAVALQLDAGSDALLRMPAVMHRTGLPRSTIYAWIARGIFPAPIRLSASRVSVWRARDVTVWLDLVSRLGHEPDADALRLALDRQSRLRLADEVQIAEGGEVGA